MRVEYRFGDDTLWVRQAGRSLSKADLRPMDPFPFGFEYVLNGRVVGYQVLGVQEYLHPGGVLTLPFDDPLERFEIEEAPYRSFSLSELIEWALEQASARR